MSSAAQTSLKFLGAAGCVTGSKTLVQTEAGDVMVDCGLFQGDRTIRSLNRLPLDIDLKKLKAVVLTHGHLDHVGYLPLLAAAGYRGPVFGTAPSIEVAKVILYDSAKIQEEHAKLAKKAGNTRYENPKPLYTAADVDLVLNLFHPVDTETKITVADGVTAELFYNGHIIGSTCIRLNVNGERILFSGDLGRPNDKLLYAPVAPPACDQLVLEATYGDSVHPKEDVAGLLERLIATASEKRSRIIIPSFSTQRAQHILYILLEMHRAGKLGGIPVVVDSPMGDHILEVFYRFPDWHRLSGADFDGMRDCFRFVETYAETWEVINEKGPQIIVAGSGMVTGGRVLTYLAQSVTNPNTQVVLIGYMAEGTKGAALLAGSKSIRLFKKEYQVRAQIHSVQSLSAHADQAEICNWLRSRESDPHTVHLNHGETESLNALKAKLESEFGFNTIIAESALPAQS